MGAGASLAGLALLRLRQERPEASDLAHFLKNCPGSGGGIRSLGDGATDDEEIGAVRQSGGGSGDALLVADGGSGGPDAGNDEGCSGKTTAERANFLGAGNQAGDSGSRSQRGKPHHLVGGSGVDSDRIQLELVHGCKDGDSQQTRGAWERGGSTRGGLQHGRSAGGMDREHFGSGRRGGTDRRGDGVGDVMELQIQKDGTSAGAQLVDQGIAFSQIQLKPHLKPAAETMKLVNEVKSGGGLRKVEGNDQAGIHNLERTGFARWQGAGSESQLRIPEKQWFRLQSGGGFRDSELTGYQRDTCRASGGSSCATSGPDVRSSTFTGANPR